MFNISSLQQAQTVLKTITNLKEALHWLSDVADGQKFKPENIVPNPKRLNFQSQSSPSRTTPPQSLPQDSFSDELVPDAGVMRTGAAIYTGVMTVGLAIGGALFGAVGFNPHNATEGLPLDADYSMKAKAIVAGRIRSARMGAIIGGILGLALSAYQWWQTEKLISDR